MMKLKIYLDGKLLDETELVKLESDGTIGRAVAGPVRVDVEMYAPKFCPRCGEEI